MIITPTYRIFRYVRFLAASHLPWLALLDFQYSTKTLSDLDIRESFARSNPTNFGISLFCQQIGPFHSESPKRPYKQRKHHSPIHPTFSISIFFYGNINLTLDVFVGRCFTGLFSSCFVYSPTKNNPFGLRLWAVLIGLGTDAISFYRRATFLRPCFNFSLDILLNSNAAKQTYNGYFKQL